MCRIEQQQEPQSTAETDTEAEGMQRTLKTKYKGGTEMNLFDLQIRNIEQYISDVPLSSLIGKYAVGLDYQQASIQDVDAIGFWKPDETATLYIDLVKLVDTEEQAIEVAKQHRQIAVFRFDRILMHYGYADLKFALTSTAGKIHAGGGATIVKQRGVFYAVFAEGEVIDVHSELHSSVANEGNNTNDGG